MRRSLFYLLLPLTLHAQKPEYLTSLPTSKQAGPTCAFHANIPALTHLTGINIDDGSPTAKAFIKSVYTLKRGDTRMTRAFSRTTFFKLFGIETKHQKSLHTKPSDLEKLTRQILKTQFNPHLTENNFISLRTTGRLGQPHNILLLGKQNSNYIYHNPTTGKIHTATSTNFSKKILTPTTATKNRTRPDYQTNFHIIKNNLPPLEKITNIANLPPDQSITLTQNQLNQIPTVQKYKTNPIEKPRKPNQALGIIYLAKLAINAHLRHKKVPIIFIQNQPHAITAYHGPFQPTTPDQLITIHNGTTQKTITTKNLLNALQSTNYHLQYINLTPPTSASKPPP